MIGNPLGKPAESVRVLQANLTDDAPHNVYVITSPRRGEGKSVVAANLAVTYAQAGLPTLLVDANLRHPTLHHVFDVEPKSTLDALLTAAEATDADAMGAALTPTDIEDLMLLPLGAAENTAQEMNNFRAFKTVVPALQEHLGLKIVIFDTSSLNYAESLMLIRHVPAQVLVVCKAFRSRQGAVVEALGQLKELGYDADGIVLNRT